MLQSCTRQSAYSVEDYANPNLNGFNSISDLASGIDCPDAGIALFRSSHCEFASHWPIKHPDKHGCVGIRGACLMPTFREPKGHSWVQDCPSGNQNRDPGTKVCQFASPEMAKRGEGAIVNLSTIAADYGAPGMSLYGSSKAAINLLTKTWAAEYGPKGLRVNAVSPGPTRLDAIESVIPPARKNPAIQIAFVAGARGERLPSLIFTNQLLKPVMSDQFGNRARPAVRMRGLLFGVKSQRFSSFECGCFSGKCVDGSHKLPRKTRPAISPHAHSTDDSGRKSTLTQPTTALTLESEPQS
jgi:Enoyl-(Acyl carrier protein) reductase